MDSEAVRDFNQLLRNSLVKHGEKDAFRGWTGLGVSYRQLYGDVMNLSGALRNLGLAGRTVGLIGENRYEWCLSFLAVTCASGVAALLDRELKAEELSILIKKGNISALIYSNSVKKIIDGLREENPGLPLICMDDIEDGLSVPVLMAGHCVKSGNKADFPGSAADGNAYSVLVFTSGTSGSAKGVMLSQYNICYDIWAAQLNLKIRPEDSFLSVLPLHHIYECMLGFLLPLYCGSTVCFSRGLRYLLTELTQIKPSVLVSVPLILETIHAQLLLKARREGSEPAAAQLREAFGGRIGRLLCGAAPLNPEIARFIRDSGICLIKGYGLSETSPIVTTELTEAFKPLSVGVPLKGIEVRISGPDEAGIGEIAVRGPIVMLGYFNDVEATRASLRDGWFYTGDLGYLDKEGWLFVTGRKKHIIVLKNGKKISPEEIELLLCRSPYIREALVWGVESETGQIVITADVLPDMERLKGDFPETADKAEMQKCLEQEIAAINRNLPFYKRIEKLVLRDREFQKTSTKKIKRHLEALQ